MTLQVIYNAENHRAVQRFCRENEFLCMYNTDYEELYKIFIEDAEVNCTLDEFVHIMKYEI